MRLTTATGDLARAQLLDSCKVHGRRFPWMQIVVLGAAIGVLSWLALDAACQIRSIPKRYSVVPTVVLAATFVAVTAGALIQGARRLDAAKEELAN